MLINKKHVKDYALAQSKLIRLGRFTRVGKSFLERINSRIAGIIASEIHSHPSKGKTLL